MQKTKALLVFSIISMFLVTCLCSINGAKAAGSGVDWWNNYGHSLDNNRVSTSKGPRSSQLLWTYTTSAPVRSSAAVVDGVVYCAGFDGTVFAINANMGIQIWKVKIGDKVWASPTVVNGRVYVGNMESVFYALNAYTGETVWTYPTASGMFNGPAVTGGVVYQASNEGTIHALDETTGALKWSFKASGEVRCTPSVVDGVVYFGSTGVASGTVYALRATDGSELWSFPTGPGESSYQDSSPAVAGGFVFIGSSDGNLYALDASSGAKKWSFKTGGKVSSSPAVFQGVVFVGSEDGKVYAFRDSTGDKIWEYSVGSPVYSSPSYADGFLYIGAYGSNKVLALDLHGTLVWSFDAGSVFASPAIANGVVYIGSYDSKLYAFGTPDGRAWGTDFNYKDLDEMKNEGWTLSNPTGTTLVPGAGVILEGSGGVTEIGYINDIPTDIFDWKIDVKGMWLGDTGHSGINVKMITEKHTYIWAIDGANSQYIFYRDGSKTLSIDGYVEKANEYVYLTIEKNGSTVSLYGDGKFIKNFLETDTLPSRVTGVALSSPSGSKNQYTYVGAFVPEAKTESPLPTEYTLVVTTIGTGSVSKTPNKETYLSGETVQLTATASVDYSFTSWSGDLSGSTNPTIITLNANKAVTATFTQSQSPTMPAVFAGGVTNGTAVASSKVTVNYQNPSTKTSYYEVKVDGKEWINNGLTTSYTFTGLDLGEHKFEVRAVDNTGATLSSSNLNIDVSVWVPPVNNALASTIVTISAVSIVSIIATAASTPSSLPFSWLWEKINSLLPEGVKGWLESFISSKRQLVIEQKTGSIFMLTRLEIFSYAASLVVMTFAFSYAGAVSLDQLILLIPAVLVTSVVVGVAKNLITEMYARMNGVWAEHQLWYFGLATFLISTFAFRTPFSSPSRIVNHSPKFTERSQGLVASASVIVSLIFVGIFYALFVAGFSYIGSIGLAMCLLGAVFDTIPIAPMNGRDIYDWSKSIWAAQFLIVLILYVVWLIMM
jgi:outer membrane protein assembly factor BamB